LKNLIYLHKALLCAKTTCNFNKTGHSYKKKVFSEIGNNGQAVFLEAMHNVLS